MPKAIALDGAARVGLSRWMDSPVAHRVAHEAATLAMACAAAVVLTMLLYLVASPEARDAILSGFLGLDQPTVTFHMHPPMSL